MYITDGVRYNADAAEHLISCENIFTVSGKQKETVRNRTKKSRNNKSSCIAERQAVVVSWTHPEKGGIPPDFRCSGNLVTE